MALVFVPSRGYLLSINIKERQGVSGLSVFVPSRGYLLSIWKKSSDIGKCRNVFVPSRGYLLSIVIDKVLKDSAFSFRPLSGISIIYQYVKKPVISKSEFSSPLGDIYYLSVTNILIVVLYKFSSPLGDIYYLSMGLFLRPLHRHPVFVPSRGYLLSITKCCVGYTSIYGFRPLSGISIIYL